MCNLSDLVEERGIEKGRLETLLSQIRKKVMKGKSLARIADELEESADIILPLYHQVLQETDRKKERSL
ncbi:MAG: hypothetical protein PUC30_12765 [Lachnospiraceae bacterium]|nr:hypothetical protein [Lachnospiraceae bacterium]